MEGNDQTRKGDTREIQWRWPSVSHLQKPSENVRLHAFEVTRRRQSRRRSINAYQELGMPWYFQTTKRMSTERITKNESAGNSQPR